MSFDLTYFTIIGLSCVAILTALAVDNWRARHAEA